MGAGAAGVIRSLAALLLVLIAGVHYGGDLLALGYPDPDQARKAIYYVLRSLEGAIQYGVIAALAFLLWVNRAAEPGRVKGAAFARSSVALVVLVCSWGAAEHLQAAACRLSLGIATKPPTGAALTGICDGLTGLPLYAAGVGVIAFLAAVIAAHSLGEKNA